MKLRLVLPAFNGFVGSKFEDYDVDNELDYINELRTENGLKPLKNDDRVVWDNMAYFDRIAELMCQTVDDFLSDMKIAKDFKFIDVYRPRDYYQENDRIYCTADVSVKQTKAYIHENVDAFERYVNDRFSSRSGFHSFYSNDVNEWLFKMNRFGELDHNELNAILDFICENEEFELEDNLDGRMRDVPMCPECSNLEELTTKK